MNNFNYSPFDNNNYPYPELPRNTRPALDKYLNIDPDLQDGKNRRDFLKSLNDQYRTVREFARNEINQECYAAVVMGQIYDKSHDNKGNITNPKIQAVLSDYIKCTKFDDDPERDKQKKIYLVGLLRDRTCIDNLRAQTFANAALGTEPRQFSDEQWLQQSALAKPEVLAKTAETINVESLLIASAESLQKLNDNCSNSLATMQEVVFTEQILEPMAEMIGFDGLAMALSSRSKEVRLTNAGRSDLLDRADNMLNCISAFDREHNKRLCVERAVSEINGAVFGAPHSFVAEPAIETTGDNEAIFGTIIDQGHRSNLTPAKDNTVGRFRLKSRGSLAMKLYNAERDKAQEFAPDQSDVPMDLLGMTLIAKDEAEQRKIFAQVVTGIYNCNSIHPLAANSKISPVHIAGTEDYIERLLADLSQRGGTNRNPSERLHILVDGKPAEDAAGLHLAKVTFSYDNIPVEIQIVTQQARDEMRCGKLAHIIYKARTSGNNPGDVDQLAKLLPSIHARRKHISLPNLVGSSTDAKGVHIAGASEQRARELLRQVDNPSKINTLGKLAVIDTTLS